MTKLNDSLKQCEKADYLSGQCRKCGIPVVIDDYSWWPPFRIKVKYSIPVTGCAHDIEFNGRTTTGEYCYG